ncbi:proline racemase [Lentibacillus lipolyticus]|nr:proline racemase [Lentibacillus lipolyticus]
MLNLSGLLQTVDTHTMGEPTRIVLKGIPRLTAGTMWEKKQELEEKFDHLRKLLMNEPRGHSDMFGAFITEPCHQECDLGVVFADTGGYLNMCGHGTIGVVTAGISLGIIEKKEVVSLDTPAGVIQCKVTFNNDQVAQVSFQNVPSFIYKKDVTVDIEGIGDITLDIAYGGNFFAILNAAQLQKPLTLENTSYLAELGIKIRDKVNEEVRIVHPDIPNITTVDLVEFSVKLEENNYRNVVVFGDGQIDRSPCGTGTSAKLALLDLPVGGQMRHESIIDTYFTARVLERTTVGHHEAIVPEISGSAWITGFHQFILDHTDPFEQGFLIKK